MDLYDVLGTSRDATQNALYKAYHKKLNQSGVGTLELDKVHEAYNILSNMTTKQMYDEGLIEINTTCVIETPGNLFLQNKFLSEHYLTPNNELVGDDIHKNVILNLTECYTGCTKTIIHEVRYPCSVCFTECNVCKGKRKVRSRKQYANYGGMTTDVTVNCTKCDGLGYIHNTHKKELCQKCNGSKTLETEETIEHIDKVSYKCRACNGNKWVMTKGQKQSCSICSGQGRIFTETKRIKVLGTKALPCDECKGTGERMTIRDICSICQNMTYISVKKCIKLYLHPGIKTDTEVIIKNNGQQLLNGEPGNLKLIIKIDDTNSIFVKVKEHIRLELYIHFVQTIIGTEYEIILPSLERLKINTFEDFHEILNPLKLYTYKGKGMPIWSNKERKIIDFGDLHIHFKVMYSNFKKRVSKSQITTIANCFVDILDIES